jgi:glutaredoxin
LHVQVYTKTNCPQCVVVKNKLALRGVDYEEINIEKDATLRAWLIGQGHRSVPVVYVDGIHTNPDAVFGEIVG